MHHELIFGAVIISLVLVMSVSAGVAGEDIAYPKTEKVDQVDDYFGTKVADPYRWLEDDNSAPTKAWVQKENAVTNAYLEQIPYRGKVRQRLTELFDYARYSAPFHRGNRYFFYKNDGLQNQSVLYVQEGLNGQPQVLIDPNTFSKDGTSRLTAFELSMDGRYACYSISVGGSDWQEFHVMDVQSRRTLGDTLKWVKVSGIGWLGDGFYYSRYDAPPPGKELVGSNENHEVFFHKVGTAQEADTLVYQDPAHPLRFHVVSTTEDQRFSILYISDAGTGRKGNMLFYRETGSPDQTFKPIISEIGDDEYVVIDNIGGKLLVQTNHKAPNDQLVLIDPAQPDELHWQTIVAEQPEPLKSATTTGNKLFTIYLKDVTSRVQVRDLSGKIERQIDLPTLGSAGGFSGLHDDTEAFYTFTSFIFPPTIYRYDLASGKSTLFRSAEIPHFKPDDYETSQVFATSKDGTKIPLFLVHKKGLKLDGNNPTLLYGYGGFNISLNPGFSPLRLSLLEQGFVYVQANLRGGGEYGEQWHDAGTKLKKQNVFDDFIAAAQWLIDNKITSPQHLAIQGGSNGGLLVGAVLNQRPDLFKAAIPQVGVMDMLRFQKFTLGWNWKPDYGASDDSAAQFKALYAYSPLHNIRSDVRYPAVLITTADHDDRVVPAHSFKYAATLQERAIGGPFLIRIDTNSGHGASSVSKSIAETADVQSFLFQNLGVTPDYALER
jgi:prolyl oligopeptidase